MLSWAFSFAFSLDLRGGRPLAAAPELKDRDPAAIVAGAANAGVDAILTIDLARVGSEAGPDEQLIRRLRAAVPAAMLVAGGGVRDVGDLERLAARGCDAALVATALHTGRIRRADLQRLETAGR